LTLSAWHTTCTGALGLTMGRPRSHQLRISAGGASSRDVHVPCGPAGLSSRRRAPPENAHAHLARLAELSVAVQRELEHLAGGDAGAADVTRILELSSVLEHVAAALTDTDQRDDPSCGDFAMPPAAPARQGLTLVQLSAQRKRFLR
jgi:hypothetical protein